MKVDLVAITQPMRMSTDEFVAYCARVSNPGNQHNHDTSPKLLSYLRRHGHWSPFEMAHAVMRIETTRDIARQMLRHRSFSFQEFSQRYAVAADFDLSRARRQDDKNRQNSIDDLPWVDQEWWHQTQQYLIERASDVYAEALRRGVAKECARKVLPEGLTVSTLFMAGSFRSWMHYLEQRTHPSTQLEHREVAIAIRDILAERVPTVFGCSDP